MDRETIGYLLKEHEGELLIHEDDNYSLKVKYSSGALPMFSKLEVFILDRTKFSIVDGKVKINHEELQASFEAYQFRKFIPLLKFALIGGDISPDTFEEAKRNILDGLYPFVRLKDSRVEMLIVSAGNLEKKGVFYYPDQEAEAIALIEFSKGNVKIYKENFEKIPQL
jgi:hypothetical protein